ncbi:MAG: hypothetical protein AB7O59_06535 [Pirellulales bacterium]
MMNEDDVRRAFRRGQVTVWRDQLAAATARRTELEAQLAASKATKRRLVRELALMDQERAALREEERMLRVELGLPEQPEHAQDDQ